VIDKSNVLLHLDDSKKRKLEATQKMWPFN